MLFGLLMASTYLDPQPPVGVSTTIEEASSTQAISKADCVTALLKWNCSERRPVDEITQLFEPVLDSTLNALVQFIQGAPDVNEEKVVSVEEDKCGLSLTIEKREFHGYISTVVIVVNNKDTFVSKLFDALAEVALDKRELALSRMLNRQNRCLCHFVDALLAAATLSEAEWIQRNAAEQAQGQSEIFRALWLLLTAGRAGRIPTPQAPGGDQQSTVEMTAAEEGTPPLVPSAPPEPDDDEEGSESHSGAKSDTEEG